MSKDTIHTLRKKIDKIDKALIKKITERMKTSRAIGVLKKKQGAPIRDTAREKEMHESHNRLTHAVGLDRKLTTKIFTLIIDESRKTQK